MRAVGTAAALAVLLACPAPGGTATAPCPATATVTVYALNLGADPNVTLSVAGDLASTATCLGSGLRHYQTTLSCTGTGLVRCGTLTGLSPGVWLDHRDGPQQTRRDVLLADGPGVSNSLTWTLYAHTYQVTTTDPADLLGRLRQAEASGGPALVTFALPPASVIAFTAADPACPPGAPALVCLLGSTIVLDGLDATGAPGVTLSAGTLDYRLVRVFGQDDVLRGLLLRGGRFTVPLACRPDVSGPGCPTQADTVDFAPGALRDRLEDATVFGPARGDAVSVEGTDVLVTASEITGADDKGLKATDGGSVTVRDSCLHDNANGGIQSTRGGQVTAARNVVEHNLPREAQNGILAINEFPGLSAPSTITTDGNIVRFNGARGLSVSGNATATFTDDFVADNGVVGARIEGNASNPAAVASARFRGVAIVCNHRDRLTGTCTGNAALACAGDGDCCDGTGACAGTCNLATFPAGVGTIQATCGGCALPGADYGTGEAPGMNAFAFNPNNFQNQNGFNLEQAVPAAVSARGNQWEQGATSAPCSTTSAHNPDICVVPGASVDAGSPSSPRAGAPTLESVVPARPRAGDLVRVYGSGFDAIDGVACADESQTAPATPCTGEDDKIAARNAAASPSGNHVTVTLGGQPFPADVWAVTPTMLAFRMPVDCFATGTLAVARADDAGVVRTATIALCRPQSCAGEPAATPCDDGDACTAGDHCSGTDDTCVPGTPVACTGPCATGICDPERGCVPAPAATPCDDGDACTVGDHCRGDAPVCVSGPACATEGLCLAEPCDPARACSAAAAVTCQMGVIAQTLLAAGGGGRAGARIGRLVSRVEAAVAAARGARRGRARRLLTQADAELGRLLALLRDARLPASLVTEIRASARGARAAIRAARRAL
ncbi:MAG TPA: right-handed parallel beta-helix repeat-containing protein [Candidatus Binatia bacterium]|nr:right-handed parallel beta-helix repeat-containing protein [Candidatus Binatia bacterium]